MNNKSSKLRSVRIKYSNGDTVLTSMAAGITDNQIRTYFMIGRAFNIGDGPNDQIATVIDVDILK